MDTRRPASVLLFLCVAVVLYLPDSDSTGIGLLNQKKNVLADGNGIPSTRSGDLMDIVPWVQSTPGFLYTNQSNYNKNSNVKRALLLLKNRYSKGRTGTQLKKGEFMNYFRHDDGDRNGTRYLHFKRRLFKTLSNNIKRTTSLQHAHGEKQNKGINENIIRQSLGLAAGRNVFVLDIFENKADNLEKNVVRDQIDTDWNTPKGHFRFRKLLHLGSDETGDILFSRHRRSAGNSTSDDGGSGGGGGFFDSDNNKAMYLVLPLIILVYGGCSSIYCCYKLRIYLRKKQRQRRRLVLLGTAEKGKENRGFVFGLGNKKIAKKTEEVELPQPLTQTQAESQISDFETVETETPLTAPMDTKAPRRIQTSAMSVAAAGESPSSLPNAVGDIYDEDKAIEEIRSAMSTPVIAKSCASREETRSTMSTPSISAKFKTNGQETRSTMSTPSWVPFRLENQDICEPRLLARTVVRHNASNRERNPIYPGPTNDFETIPLQDLSLKNDKDVREFEKFMLLQAMRNKEKMNASPVNDKDLREFEEFILLEAMKNDEKKKAKTLPQGSHLRSESSTRSNTSKTSRSTSESNLPENTGSPKSSTSGKILVRPNSHLSGSSRGSSRGSGHEDIGGKTSKTVKSEQQYVIERRHMPDVIPQDDENSFPIIRRKKVKHKSFVSL